MTPSPARRLALAVGLTAALVGLAACSTPVGGDAAAVTSRTSTDMGAMKPAAPTSSSESTDRSNPGSATDAASAGTTTTGPAPVAFTIDKTGWYGGFAITVTQVRAAEAAGGLDLEIDLEYRNITAEQAYVPRGVVLVDGSMADSSEDLPADATPAGVAAKGSIVVSVDQGTDPSAGAQAAIDRTSLVWGDAQDNQTTIPLSAGSAVDSVEPMTLSESARANQGQVVIDLVGGTRAPSYESGERGTDVISLRIELSCAADCQASGYYVDRGYFTLVDPAGQKLATDQLRSGFCCEALYPGTVVDDERATLAFLVPSTSRGTYTLTYEDPALTAAGSPAGTIALTG